MVCFVAYGCVIVCVLGLFSIKTLRELGIRKIRYANYRVAVGLLIGQGWEQRRPTLPKSCVDKARPKVLAFLRLNNLFGETNG